MKLGFFRGKRITVMGLGLIGGGVDTVKFLARAGANVLATDLRTRKELKQSLDKIKGLPVKLVLGKHREKDFENADLIIKNPAVPDNSPYLKIAKSNKIPIETDIGIFFQLCQAQIIGVTGTKGKSTTASLIYYLIKKKYPGTVLAGNIGSSPLCFLKKVKKKNKVVLELSNLQLQGLKKHKISPEISVITSIYQDHLNRHRSFKGYINSKKIIFEFQKPGGILVLNYDNLIVRNFAKSSKSQVFFFSQKKPPVAKEQACYVKQNHIFFHKEQTPVCSLRDLRIKGSHNLSNVLAAVSIAKILKVSNKDIKKVLSGFKGIAFRQQFIRQVKGVKYFNDTTATMPQAAIAAILSLKEHFPKKAIILIAGGEDKGLNYRSLAKCIKNKVKETILLPGSASVKLKKELFSLGVVRKKIKQAKSLKQAVQKASRLANRGEIVLFSPAAASFNLFLNEFDRGEQFNDLIKKL